MTMNLTSPPNFEFELLRAVVEQAPDAIIVTNNAGDIRVWNKNPSARSQLLETLRNAIWLAHVSISNSNIALCNL